MAVGSIHEGDQSRRVYVGVSLPAIDHVVDVLTGARVTRLDHTGVTHPWLSVVHRQDGPERATQELREGNSQASSLPLGRRILLLREADLGSNHGDNILHRDVITGNTRLMS